MAHTTSNAADASALSPEARITQVARELFIRKGFAETSMSEIADTAGINRPTLHYYFRTKDKMYNAVFGQIIETILPKVQDLIDSDAYTVGERVALLVDIYYDMLSHNPGLPLFVVREIGRNPAHLFHTIRYSPMHDVLCHVAERLECFMDRGEIRRMPFHILFFSFYGLLTFPLLSYGIVGQAYAPLCPCLQDLLKEWKPYLVSQIVHLLTEEE